MKFLQDHQKTAVIFGEQRVSYTQLLQEVTKYASVFQTQRCKKVAIYSENRLEWVYAFYAAWKNYCIAVPIDFMATPEEVAYILEDCQPEVIFCSREKARDLESTFSSLSYTIQCFVFEDLQQSLEAIQAPEHPDFPEANKDDTAMIIYTSGTTGSPKGVMISFDNILANAESVAEDVKIYTPEQRVLVLLPLHHVYPLMGTIIIPLYIGETCVFSPSMKSEDIIGTLQKHEITLFIGVPRLFTAIRKGIKEKIDKSFVARHLFKLAEFLDSPKFSKLVFKKVHERFGGKMQFMPCGGAALDNEVARDFKTLGFDLLNGYGMTESTPMISFTRPGKLKIGASGQILPKNEVRIVDGEITAKGRNIMQGYYNRPDETAQVIRDGWLYTGDLGYVDEENYVFVTGRKKDIIVLPSGKNINPEEIEAKLLQNFDTISEVGVFMHENVLQAVIYPNFHKINEQGIHHIEEHFRWDVFDSYNHSASPAKKIMKFTVVKEELPKTRLGKIRRFQLPELTAKALRTTPPEQEPDSPEYQNIKEYLQAQTAHAVYPDSHLELDLGLDSLDKVSLHTYLQGTFGLDISDDEILRHPTVEQLAGYVQEKKTKFEAEGINWHRILQEPVSLSLPTSSPIHGMGNNVLKFLMRRYFRLSVGGYEHLQNSPFILTPNHQSYLDALIITQCFESKLLRETYFYAEERHFRKSWQRLFADHHNVIIVDINRELKRSLQKMAEVLRKNKNMVLFPEGARTRDGKLAQFKKTFAILSCELNIPIVPAVIQGAYQAMPKGKTIPVFKQQISVQFLPPIFPENLSYEELTEKVYQTIKQQLGE
ncbi:AMP-dependent synthetase and ligase [Candidatus Vecturithrix granuli]|uniref:AMP-dependent synthetase and ligase n=1 Tax=Vecturithrix granuli TaxID=1499967 RepID=A0A0S6WAY2_VECG1|nr:AMP-dependent synthetase and ligase [Candidatus Vecturithrix granuli]